MNRKEDNRPLWDWTVAGFAMTEDGAFEWFEAPSGVGTTDAEGVKRVPSEYIKKRTAGVS